MATTDEPDVVTMALSGPVTLYESTEVREALIAALANGKHLRINLETSGPWDLAGLQLLISAVASGRKIGKSVGFVSVPQVCSEIAERSGLGRWLAVAAEGSA
jgi:ABC-type transporter Mla MlaB component